MAYAYENFANLEAMTAVVWCPLAGAKRRRTMSLLFPRELRMGMERKERFAPLAALLLGAVMTFAGCETKGPAEKAGESIDKGIQNAKDAVDPAGPVEKAGRSVDKAVKN